MLQLLLLLLVHLVVQKLQDVYMYLKGKIHYVKYSKKLNFVNLTSFHNCCCSVHLRVCATSLCAHSILTLLEKVTHLFFTFQINIYKLIYIKKIPIIYIMCKISCLYRKLLLFLYCKIKTYIINHLKFTVMEKFIQTVENQIKFINQFQEFSVETQVNDREVSFFVTPVDISMFSQVVINILIDVCHRFGLSYFFTIDTIKHKPTFHMYYVYNV